MIDAALTLRPQVNIYVAGNEELEHLRLLSDDWHAIEETFHFLQPFKEATKACEGDKATLDQMLVTFDIIIAHLGASLARHADKKALSAAVTCSWYALDKYYRLTDDSPVYTAALLLHPSYRKHYLDVTWRREWIKLAVDNVRAWWSREYAHLEVDECSEAKPMEEPSFFEKQKALIKLRQRIGDEFDAFIQQTPIDTANPIAWWLEDTQQRTFPRLSRMAVTMLSAPAMSAESERVFSLTLRSPEQIPLLNAYDRPPLRARAQTTQPNHRLRLHRPARHPLRSTPQRRAQHAPQAPPRHRRRLHHPLPFRQGRRRRPQGLTGATRDATLRFRPRCVCPRPPQCQRNARVYRLQSLVPRGRFFRARYQF